MSVRRTVTPVILAFGMALAGLGAGSASAAPTPVGPECQQAVRDAVLRAVQGQVEPGQVIQYLQVVTQDGVHVLQLCIVTVPA